MTCKNEGCLNNFRNDEELTFESETTLLYIVLLTKKI